MTAQQQAFVGRVAYSPDVFASGFGVGEAEKLSAVVGAKPPHLLVVRHAESFGQIDPSAYGSIGDAKLPLTEWGYEKQSVEAGKFLGNLAKQKKFETIHVVASTCLRTQQTADGLIRGMDAVGAGALVNAVTLDARLSKQKFGQFDGIFSDKEKAVRFPNEFAAYQHQLTAQGPFVARPPGGESIADSQERVRDFLRDTQQGVAGKADAVVIVTHGTIALCIENILMNRGNSWVLSNIDKGENLKTVHLAPQLGGNGYASEQVYAGVKRPADQPHIGKQPYTGELSRA